jgi:hypothetical protein
VAILFALVVNFGSDEAAARAAHDLVLANQLQAVGDLTIGLHEPFLRHGPYLEMSVVPIGVGWAGPANRAPMLRRLSAAQLTELGHCLYRLLTEFTGYRAAVVGWERDELVNVDELDEAVPGLVLADDVRPDLRGPAFVRFMPGFRWIPYAGERPSTLTAG